MGVNIMVDLETWGDTNDAAIVSIGAVKFDRMRVLERFHVGVTPESNEIYKRQITASTMQWWLAEERAEARKAWFQLEKTDLASALEGFRIWCTTPEEIPFDGEPYQITALWGNGATFDNVILRSACAATGIEYPVPFWQDKCYRTLKGLRPDIKLERIGTHHDAADDAHSQAEHAIRLAQAMGILL